MWDSLWSVRNVSLQALRLSRIPHKTGPCRTNRLQAGQGIDFTWAVCLQTLAPKESEFQWLVHLLEEWQTPHFKMLHSISYNETPRWYSNASQCRLFSSAFAAVAILGDLTTFSPTHPLNIARAALISNWCQLISHPCAGSSLPRVSGSFFETNIFLWFMITHTPPYIDKSICFVPSLQCLWFYRISESVCYCSV